MKKKLSLILSIALFLVASAGYVAAQDGSDGKDEEKGDIFGKTIATSKMNDVVFALDISKSMYYWDKKKDRGPRTGDNADDGLTTKVELPNGNVVTIEDLPEHKRTRIARTKMELIDLITKIPNGNTFNVIFFGTKVSVAREGKMIKATKDSKMKVIKAIAKKKPKGATRTDLALKKAFEIKQTKRIYLLSDGAPFKPGEGYMDTKGIIKDVKKRNKERGVKIYTLGFDGKPVPPKKAPRGNETWQGQLREARSEMISRLKELVKFLKGLAEENGGDYTSIQ